MRDYYGILGIDASATNDEIRHAYRRLAKMWHPDRYVTGPDTLRQQAERRMRLLTEAYAALSDPMRRTSYDHQRQSASAGDSVYVMGTPINIPNPWTIPGYQSSTRLHPETVSTDDSLRLVIALLLGLIALGAILHTGESGTVFAGGVAITIGLTAALTAIGLVMGHGPIIRGTPARSRPAPPPTPEPDPGRDHFVELVRHALDSLPDEFAQNLDNVAIVVRHEPTREILQHAGVKPGYTLLGLYSGVAITQRSAAHGYMPAQITLFQGPIERHCLFNGERIEQQVRATLLHEVAHHFGMDHDEMPLWVKA